MRRLAGFATAVIVVAGCAAAGAAEELGDGTSGLRRALPVTGGQLGDSARGGSARPLRAAPRVTVGPPVLDIATVRRWTLLRRSPGGRVVGRIGRRTVFGGPQMLAVVGWREDWIAVLHEALPNGRAGWIPRDAARITTTPWRLRVDRSDRTAKLLRGDRVLERFRVGIGAPGSPTPLGRFAITDRMVTRGASAGAYGCCILALSGRQPSLPAGWQGGDRLALHGSPGDREVGLAATAGCMTARASVLKRLLRRLPVGTRVDIRA